MRFGPVEVILDWRKRAMSIKPLIKEEGYNLNTEVKISMDLFPDSLRGQILVTLQGALSIEQEMMANSRNSFQIIWT